MSLGSNEAIKHSVAAGLGIAVLSQLAVQQSVWLDNSTGSPGSTQYPSALDIPSVRQAGLCILQVSGFPILRHWSVVWRKDIPLSATAKHFLQYLQSAEVLSLQPQEAC